MRRLYDGDGGYVSGAMDYVAMGNAHEVRGHGQGMPPIRRQAATTSAMAEEYQMAGRDVPRPREGSGHDARLGNHQAGEHDG